MRISTLVLSLLIVAGSLIGQNLLTNGGFEAGLQGWSTHAEDGSSATFDLVADAYEGSQALDINVAATGANVWSVQIIWNGFPVMAGAIYTVEVWAKTDVAGQSFRPSIGMSGPPYSEYAASTPNLTTDWAAYEFDFIAPVTTTDGIKLAIALPQTGSYQVDHISIAGVGDPEPYCPECPPFNFSDDASWYGQAENRIDDLRKNNYSFDVLDSLGQNVSVPFTVTLKKHEFEWGSTLESKNDVHDNWMRQTHRLFFNSAVFENNFKWYNMEPQQGVLNYSSIDNDLSWADTAGIHYRGHALVWGGSHDWQNPIWTHPEIQNDQPTGQPRMPYSELMAAVETRIRREMAYFSGRISEYDVLNESFHQTYLAEYLGNSINRNVYAWARDADPDAKLFVNEYSVWMGPDTWTYRDHIANLLATNTPIDGIGLQGHLGDNLDVNTLRTNLDILSEFDLPLKITEFDMDAVPESDQADRYETALRTAFSHPSVEGFYFWGIWDGRHWRPGAGLFAANKEPKEAADRVWCLLNEYWSTDTTLQSNSTSTVDLSAFRGEYSIQVDYPEGSETYFVNLNSDNAGQVISLQQGIPLTSIESDEPILPRPSALVYPNPSNANVNLRLHLPEVSEIKVSLFDVRGRFVQEIFTGQARGRKEFHLDTSMESSGVYFVVIEGQNLRIVEKFSLLK